MGERRREGFSCMQVIRPSPGVKILRLLQCHVCHVPRDHGKVYHRTDTRTHTHTVSVCLCLSGPSVRRLLFIWPVYPSSCPCSLPPTRRTRYFWRHSSLSLLCFALDPFSPHSGPRTRRSSHVAAARIAADSHHLPPPQNPRPECSLSGPLWMLRSHSGPTHAGGRGASVTVAYGLS